MTTETTDETGIRRTHLIKAVRVWLNRVVQHTQSGNAGQAEQAARNALAVLNLLETI